MDIYSTDHELGDLHTQFHQYQYRTVVDADQPTSSDEVALAAKIIQLRSRIALGEAQDVYTKLKSSKAPEEQAVAALAASSLGKEEEAVQMIEKIAGAHGDNALVQVIGGTVLQAAGKSEDALALLGKHEGSLDAVALIVQIYLQQNRNDLALKKITSARAWAQDSVLYNLAESWVGMRVGGEKYQQAFYVFEELAQAPATSTAQTLVAQAVAELHMGRTEEAQAALDQAMQEAPGYADAIANALVLQVVTGQSPEALRETLQKTAPSHAFLTGLSEKSELFDVAAAKFSAKVAA